MAPKAYVIGLTGNIATGKSTIAAMLGALGACTLDADRLAHTLMRSGSEVYRRIVARFGPEMVGSDGEIDRTRLGAVVFSHPEALADLERIVHPAVVEESQRWLAACTQPVAVIEAIKLLESGMDRFCDAIWVVTAPREQQLARLVETRHLTPEQAALRIDAQPPAETKLARADVVIENYRGLDDAWRQVVAAWNQIPGAPSVSPETPRPGAIV